MLIDQHMWCREGKFIVLMYELQSIVKTLEWTTEFLKPKSTRLILYLSLAGFVCGFSLLDPYVAYAENIDENCVCANSGRHKGRFVSKWRMSVLKNLTRASDEKSQENQNNTEEGDIDPPGKQCLGQNRSVVLDQ